MCQAEQAAGNRHEKDGRLKPEGEAQRQVRRHAVGGSERCNDRRLRQPDSTG